MTHAPSSAPPPRPLSHHPRPFRIARRWSGSKKDRYTHAPGCWLATFLRSWPKPAASSACLLSGAILCFPCHRWRYGGVCVPCGSGRGRIRTRQMLRVARYGESTAGSSRPRIGGLPSRSIDWLPSQAPLILSEILAVIMCCGSVGAPGLALLGRQDGWPSTWAYLLLLGKKGGGHAVVRAGSSSRADSTYGPRALFALIRSI